jgi:hypothetical protein
MSYKVVSTSFDHQPTWYWPNNTVLILLCSRSIWSPEYKPLWVEQRSASVSYFVLPRSSWIPRNFISLARNFIHGTYTRARAHARRLCFARIICWWCFDLHFEVQISNFGRSTYYNNFCFLVFFSPSNCMMEIGHYLFLPNPFLYIVHN